MQQQVFWEKDIEFFSLLSTKDNMSIVHIELWEIK